MIWILQRSKGIISDRILFDSALKKPGLPNFFFKNECLKKFKQFSPEKNHRGL
jgi:hypothetical protein